jgi:hypothetical protein
MNFKNFATIAGLATGAAVALAAMPAQAVSFTVEGYECPTCVNFDDAGLTTIGGDVVNPSVSNSDHKTPGTDVNAAAGDTSNAPVSSFSFATKEGTPLEVFGLDGVFEFFWGSVDNYNVITFFNGDTEVDSFTGVDIADVVLGLGAPTKGAGNYNFDALVKFTGDFTKATLTSTNIAFEVAAAPSVPEPASILGLAMVGLIGGSFVKRRSQEA